MGGRRLTACGGPHAQALVELNFDTKDHGHANFAEMVKALDLVVEIKKGESGHLLRLR